RVALLAAAAAGLAGAGPYLWMLDRWEGWGLVARLAATGALYAGVAAVYLGVARALGVSELGPALRRLRR
ncbi:MAG TPA: hypothetical protein VM778_02395, partial [Gemmatimonadota bacterium]|nr:hypothetical protein [Gemmatimonadota bacterium]